MPSVHDISVVWHNGGRTETAALGSVKADAETVVSAPDSIAGSM